MVWVRKELSQKMQKVCKAKRRCKKQKSSINFLDLLPFLPIEATFKNKADLCLFEQHVVDSETKF